MAEIFAVLKQNTHPQVTAARGEIHFFDMKYRFGWEWYSRQFPYADESQILVGASSFLI